MASFGSKSHLSTTETNELSMKQSWNNEASVEYVKRAAKVHEFVCSENDIVGRLQVRSAAYVYVYESSQAQKLMITNQYKVMEAVREIEDAELWVISTARYHDGVKLECYLSK